MTFCQAGEVTDLRESFGRRSAEKESGHENGGDMGHGAIIVISEAAREAVHERVTCGNKGVHGRGWHWKSTVGEGMRDLKRADTRDEAGKLLTKVFPPMLAMLVDHKPPASWIYELKYDGFRAVAGIKGEAVALWSRNALDLAAKFPAVATLLEDLPVDDAVLDGEIVILDESGAPRFQLLQRSEDNLEHFFVFDLLWLNGHDLRKLPFVERRELLEKLLKKLPKKMRTRVQPSEIVSGDPEEELKKSAARGYEGLIAKDPNSTYEGKRSKSWIKLKAVNQQELVIIGFTPSTHSSREFGALLLGVYEDETLRFAGKVGTGFSAKLRVELQGRLEKDRIPASAAIDAPRMKGATWVKPKLVAQVHFTEWTTDGKLRHPAFLGLRPDKKPADVVREKSAALPPSAKAKSKSATKAVPKTASKPEAKKAPAVFVAKSKATSAEVILTNPDRLIYPRDGITKQDVANYYEAVAPALISALKDRPLALEHWNQGIDKPSWFHQNMGNEAQPWMTLIETPTRTSRKSIRHLAGNDRPTFRWMAQNSILTFHMWSSRAGTLEHPDWVVFDLDPAKGKGIEQAIEAALIFRGLFEDLGIPSFPKTSGKRGIHLLVPLKKGYSHEDAMNFACTLAEAVSKRVDNMTIERALVKRRGRLYLDCLQNGFGKTIVAPYALRAIDGAPVSAPLEWSEVNKKLDPSKFNLRTMPDRLAKKGDLFAPVLTGGVKLPTLK